MCVCVYVSVSVSVNVCIPVSVCVCVCVCVVKYTFLSQCLHVYVHHCNVISPFAAPRGRFMLANIVCIE